MTLCEQEHNSPIPIKTTEMGDIKARLDLNGEIGGDPEAMAIELNVMS